jgi:hypothetical protein
MENIKEFQKIAEKELTDPSWEYTKSFLKVNSIGKSNNEFIYDRYFINEHEIGFYFPVENEKYYFLIAIDICKKDVISVSAINGSRCHLTATSEHLSLKELSEITKLRYSSGWSIGDRRENGSIYNFSRINFEYYKKRSYELEEIIPLVLDELEKDVEGVRRLTEKAFTSLSICKYQYISGSTGMVIDEKMIERLNNLKLCLDIDMYIVGNEFKNE